MKTRYNPDSDRVVRQLESLIENARSFIPGVSEMTDEQLLNPSDSDYEEHGVWFDDIICIRKAIEIIRWSEYDLHEEEL